MSKISLLNSLLNPLLSPQNGLVKVTKSLGVAVSIPTAQNIYFFYPPTKDNSFAYIFWSRRVIQTRVWSQAAREIQPPLFPGGGLWTGYPSLSVLVLSSVKARSLENQSLKGVVKLNEKTGLAHRNCALCVSCIFIVGGDDAIVVLLWGQWVQRSVPTDSCPWTLLVEPLPPLLPQVALSHSLPAWGTKGKVAGESGFKRGRVITEKCYH